MTDDQVKNASNEQLLTWYKNARTTYMECGGHGKAHGNEMAMNWYAFHIKSRGLALPDESDRGRFNGEGTTG